MNNFIQRTITGAIFVTVLIASILLSPLAFFILFFIINLLTVFEFYRLVSTDEIKPQIFFGTFISLIVFAYFTYISQSFYKLNFLADIDVVFKVPFLIALLFFMIFIFELYRKSKQPFVNIALTITGIVYVALPFSLFACIGFYPGGQDIYHPHILMGFLFLLWASDTGAYLTGMKFGKHRLFERISPKKSWEGSIGGTVAALLVAYILSHFYRDLKLIDWMVIAIIIVVTGTLGDLVESMLKRSIGIKDSGTIFPGHGGMLDRFDGLLGAAPFVFFYLIIFGRI